MFKKILPYSVIALILIIIVSVIIGVFMLFFTIRPDVDRLDIDELVLPRASDDGGGEEAFEHLRKETKNGDLHRARPR